MLPNTMLCVKCNNPIGDIIDSTILYGNPEKFVGYCKVCGNRLAVILNKLGFNLQIEKEKQNVG